MRHDVADHIELATAGMRQVNALGEVFQLAKIIVAHAQRIARLAGVNRGGAKIQRGARHFQRACGGEEFWRFHAAYLKTNQAA